MKILIVQEASRDSRNKEYRECLCLQRALIRQGHKATVWGLGFPNYAMPFDMYAEDCDAILFLENYDTSGWTPNLSSITDKVKLFWSIDGHVTERHHIDLAQINRYDIILNSCLPMVDTMQEHCAKSVWFPNAYPADLFDTIVTSSRDIDFGYVGSYGSLERRSALERLEGTAGLRIITNAMGDSMVQALKRITVGFNMNVGFDINYRTFESIGSGIVLLTNDTPGLSELFTIGEEVVVYRDIEDCAERAKELSSDKELLAMIALNGQERAAKNHTYDQRAQRLVELVKEML